MDICQGGESLHAHVSHTHLAHAHVLHAHIREVCILRVCTCAPGSWSVTSDMYDGESGMLHATVNRGTRVLRIMCMSLM